MNKKTKKIIKWCIAIFGTLILLFSVFYLLMFLLPVPTDDDPTHVPKNWEVGINGEPPFIHQEDYSKTYVVLYTDYIKAIDLLFTFANEQGFDTIQFGECNKDALKYQKENKQLPCGAVYFEKGCPVKNLARLVIIDKQVSGCRYSGPNYIGFNIILSSSGNKEIAKSFADNYHMKFNELAVKYNNLKQRWNESSCDGFLEQGNKR